MNNSGKDPKTQLNVVEMICNSYSGSTDTNVWFIWFADKENNRYLQVMNTCPASSYKVGKPYIIHYGNALSKTDRNGNIFYSMKLVSKATPDDLLAFNSKGTDRA